MSNSVNPQLNMPLSDQGRQDPTPYRDQSLLERCLRVLEIDHRIEKLRNEEMRRLYLGEDNHLVMPAAEAGSQSAAQLPWLLRSSVNSTLRRLELPSSDSPSLSSSGTNEIPGVGDQSRHGLGDTVTISTPQRHSRLIDAAPSDDVRDDPESRTAATAITPACDRRDRQQPQRGREPASTPGRFHPYRGSASQVTSRPRIPTRSSRTNGEPQSDPPSAGADAAPAPAPQAVLSPLFVGGHRFCTPAAVRTFFCNEGLDVPPSIPQGYTLASVTPNVTSKKFTALFGGRPIHERPLSRNKEFLCINRDTQPYAPTSPGEAGLLFVLPNTIILEDSCRVFHVFVGVSPSCSADREKRLRYFGTYTKVPTTRTTLGVDEWRSLAIRCRDIWSWRIITSKAVEVRTIVARASLRYERPNKPSPSLDDVEQWLKNNLNSRKGDSEKSPTAIVRDALDVGQERLEFEVVKCVHYDLEIVKSLQAELASR